MTGNKNQGIGTENSMKILRATIGHDFKFLLQSKLFSIPEIIEI